jgi:hypothetical protein
MDIKWLEREADHSPQFGVAVKNAWIYLSIVTYSCLTRCLIMHKDKFKSHSPEVQVHNTNPTSPL